MDERTSMLSAEAFSRASCSALISIQCLRFIASSEDDEYVYGRGACDAKGVLAAMVFAAVALRERGVTDLGLLFVVGEEVDSVGALAANRLESRSRYVVVGEPTENRWRAGTRED